MAAIPVGQWLSGNNRGNVLVGSDGQDHIFGRGGKDTITGGGNLDHDVLSGGSGNDTFLDTRAGLNGDTIIDFAAGDSIIFSDATLAAFTFSLTGNVLAYSGGSVTLTGLSGPLVATTAANGGVQLALGSSTAPSPRPAPAPVPTLTAEATPSPLSPTPLASITVEPVPSGDGRSSGVVRGGREDMNNDGAHGALTGGRVFDFATGAPLRAVTTLDDRSGDSFIDSSSRGLSSALNEPSDGFILTGVTGFTNATVGLNLVDGATEHSGWSAMATDYDRGNIQARQDAGAPGSWLGQSVADFIATGDSAAIASFTDWHLQAADVWSY